MTFRFARLLQARRSRRCATQAPSNRSHNRLRRLCFQYLETRTMLDASAALSNVILMIGDGMGFAEVDAGRMFLGGEIVFDRFPYRAEITTYSANSTVTDSAAAGTAIATGQKADNGVISTAIPGDGSQLLTTLEAHRDLGRATGLVTTTQITHATPAAFAAHADGRGDTDDIADDLLSQTRPNVLFGGGGAGMTVENAAAAGYTVVGDRDGLLALHADAETYVSGQFGTSHLPYEYDSLGNLPHLSEMTATALDVLDNDPDGFFLMVEGGRIDHAGHVNDIQRLVHEMAEFADTVQLVLDWAAGRTDTLIIVTADHETGGLTVTGDNGQGVAPEVQWSTKGHTGVNVPLYAWGAGAELVGGVLDNTDLFALTAATATPSDRIRISPDGARATIFGTEGDDSLEIVSLPLFEAQLYDVRYGLNAEGGGSLGVVPEVRHKVVLNGIQYEIDGVESVRFIGGGGSDSAMLVGSWNDESATLYPNSATVTGPGYEIELTGVASIELEGGGGFDTARLFDSPGRDKFVGAPGFGKLYGEGFSNEVRSFEQVYAEASAGGHDTAKFYDSPGNDKLTATPNYARLRGDGFSIEAKYFDGVHTYGTAGGVDVAMFYDSPGNDKFVATSYSGALFGEGFYNRAKFFEGVHAFGTAGGRDVAMLFDSPGNDSFVATPTSGALFGEGFYNRAKFFEGVHAYATAGGIDEAKLFDSPGDDVFHATQSQGALFGDGFYNRAKHFEKINAYSDAGGTDRAIVYDATIQSGFASEPIEDPDALFAKVVWLYEFEELFTGSQSSEDPPVEQAVDAILTVYWP